MSDFLPAISEYWAGLSVGAHSFYFSFAATVAWLLGLKILRECLGIPRLERRVRAIEDERATAAAQSQVNAAGRPVKLWRVRDRYETTVYPDDESVGPGVFVALLFPERAIGAPK